MSIAPALTPPSSVEGNLLQADAEITTLWNDVFAWEHASDTDGEHFDDVRALGAFFDSWKGYLATEPSTFWGATYDNVQNWRARAAEWYDRAASWGVELHGVRPAVETPSNLGGAVGTFLGLSVGTIVVIVLGLMIARRYIDG